MRYIPTKSIPLFRTSCIRVLSSSVKNAAGSSSKIMNLSSINQDIVKFEYAVRGALAIRAEELKTDLASKSHSHPFSKIIACNIGNPQQLQQKPITFLRQVLSLVEYPELMSPQNLPVISKVFPADVVSRAKELLKSVDGSMGAYSHSQGIPLVRKRVADFIEKRDGYPADPNHIFLTAGASAGVQYILQTLISNDNVGIMIPIPQYPLYTATISLFRGQAVPYYLNESQEWGLSVTELTRSLQESRSKGIDVRALCVINPGNPTGQCLTEENMRDIIAFCQKEKLVLLADEVYQTNVYIPKLPFHSFKKVLKSMGPKYNNVELVSFHSISKGMVGECGRRGGYFECVNIDPSVREMLYKMASVSLCPPVSGQLAVELMVNPPKRGDPSFDAYNREMDGIYSSLKRRAQKLAKAFNELEGVSCNPAQGAMYLFPRIRLPVKAIDAAKEKGVAPDGMYCMELLNATGVCVVPGSGFGQVDGTYHFRSTFLPPEDQMDSFIQSIRVFHDNFMKQYQ